MSTLTITSTDTYEIIACYKCATPFGLPTQFIIDRREDHVAFFCPQGHSQGFYGPSEAQKLKKELERKEATLERERGWRREAYTQTERLERSRRALKGVATRRANELARVKNGVCPCCNRSFKGLSEHMAKQHPDYRPVEQVEAVTSVTIPHLVKHP